MRGREREDCRDDYTAFSIRLERNLQQQAPDFSLI